MDNRTLERYAKITRFARTIGSYLEKMEKFFGSKVREELNARNLSEYSGKKVDIRLDPCDSGYLYAEPILKMYDPEVLMKHRALSIKAKPLKNGITLENAENPDYPIAEELEQIDQHSIPGTPRLIIKDYEKSPRIQKSVYKRFLKEFKKYRMEKP